MPRLPLTHLQLNGKKVLIRVDFNVPLDEKGMIVDDSRIEAALPTIKYVLGQGGLPILMSHLGRPKGKAVAKFSLAPCAKRLSTLLSKPVIMAPDCIGEKVEKLAGNLCSGESLLLENLRFHDAEEHPASDPAFAKGLAKLADYYINDAFGAAHRVHSSTVTIVQYFPGRAAAGLLFEKEIKFLGQTLQKPQRPFYALIGGAKISTKLGVIKSLISKVDTLLIGGAMAYTFLKALGTSIGNSPYEPDLIDTAKGTIDAFRTARVGFKLPLDHVVVKQLREDAPAIVVSNARGIPSGYQGVDIGPATIASYKEELSNAATILWNGPVGVFEIKPFSKGTRTLAEAIAETEAIKIVGGGDSVAAIRSANLAHRFTHLSTGGGACLEYIEKGTLPALEALSSGLSAQL